MLERAAPCLEPALQNLFRSVEAPTRSQRRLPHAFWRHARIAQDHTSWWPAYLDDIRRISQVREGIINSSLPPRKLARVPPFTSPQWLVSERSTTPTTQGSNHGARRHISKVVKQTQTRERQEFEDALQITNQTTRPVDINIMGPEHIPEPLVLRSYAAEMTPSERLQGLIRSGSEPRFHEVWSTFVSLKDHARLARPVLRYLSRSPDSLILRRALRIFQTIELQNRTQLTYESAVRAYIGLRKYSTANQVVLEALESGLGQESAQLLMCHLVEKEMWKSAEQTLRVFTDHTRSESFNTTTTNEHVLRNLREAPVWKRVDDMLALPRKLIALCKRLQGGDSVLALNKSGIEYFATRLLERTLRSTKIMAVITPEGVLALLEIFRELKLLHFEHYLDALSALRNLRDSRNRSQLALLIFRNMRWRYPKRRLRDSTYGTMISILSAAPNEPQTFDYILQDLTRAALISSSIAHNRKPELAMYQRIMATCADQGHVTYVDELLQRLIRDHGVPRELAYFTPSLLSRAKRGDVDQTRSCFADLSLKYNLEPNAHCWNILLLAYAKADDFQGAAAVFREMQDFGVDADSYTFGTLMSICSNAGDTAAVLELVNLARERHISASTAMIDTIVHAYCMNEEVRQAENLVEAATQMELSGPPTRMWNTLLRHHAFRGDSASMLRTQERMRELAIQPDGMTYAALMTSLVVMGDTKQAAAVLRSLHISQVVTISRFHYSIILHGYVREGQRDLATAIYSEMLERFHQPSPSARLAMMHLQSQRDDLKARSRATNAALEWTGRPQTFTDPLQRHSIDFLADALVEIAETEAVPTEPQPGFQRRRPSLASSAIYIEVAFSMLARGAAYGKAKVLLTRYEAMLNKSTGSKQQKSAQTVQLLTAQMQGLIRSLEGSGLSTERYSDQSRTQLDGIWTRILDQAILAHGERDLGLLDEPLIAGPSEIKPVGGSESLSVKLNPTPVANLVKIIPASRYALAAPLSVYIRGLALQRRFSELEDELRRVQNLGFELNGKTWNTYVQVLSREHDTVLQAFRTFEEKLLPNAPPWNVLKRGKLLFTGLEPSSVEANAPSRIGQIPVPRSLVEKRQPGHLIPTYFTVVHLAAAYIKSYLTRPEAGDDKISLYAELRQQAPGTTKLIKDMPYLKDRVQGVLLRGRSVKGDPVKRIRESPRLDRIGLLGSDALLDGISPEQIDALEMSKESEEEMLSLINEIERPVTRSPLVSAKRRVSENQDTYERRVAKEEAKHKALTRRLLEESHNKEVHTVADETVGDPHVDGLPPEELDNTIVAEKNTAIAPSPTNNNTPNLSPLRKHAQSLRALSKNPGNIHKPWKIVPRRKQQPRIIPYASKQPGYFLKPMGDYFHQSLVFTKPMLSLDVPRRRELGSEQRAFTREKTMLALRKERHAEVARAQARKKRDELDRRWRGTNEIGFLEARLVRDSEVMRGTDASGDTMSQQTEAAFEVHVDEQRTRSGPADAATLREARTLDPELRRGLISSYGSDDVDDTDFLPLNRGAGEQPQTLTQEDTGDVPNDAGEGQDATFSTKAPEQHNAAEEVAVPYSGLPVEGFGESDFVDYMRPQSERRSVPSGSR